MYSNYKRIYKTVETEQHIKLMMAWVMPRHVFKKLYREVKIVVSNSNWTEWSTIQGVITRVISKSDEREARGRFEITSTITPWIVRHEVQLLINRIYNKFRN